MSEAIEKLKPLLTALSPEERDQLVQFMDELDGIDPIEADWDPEYQKELDQRLDDLQSDRVKGIPAEEVVRQLREKFG